MRIVFGMRPDYLTNRGGDTFQMLKTKEYLEQYDETFVDIISSPDELDSKYDVLHIFNLQNCDFAYSMMQAAKEKGIKVVLSPIVWRFGHSSYVNKLMRLTNSLDIVKVLQSANVLFEHFSVYKRKKDKQYILEHCDMVLPNSDEEGEILREQYGIDFHEMVVPNCIDVHLNEEHQEIQLPENFILQVGRIEPTKNQLCLLQAMMDHKEIPLVFVGKQNKIKKFYVDQLKKLAVVRGNTFFIEELPQTQLAQYYKAAAVHVLPSFRESPGLVTLEALFYGCNIVVSDERFCPVRYYKFDKLGYICDPYSAKSIEDAVMCAYRDKKVCAGKDYFDFFSYQNAARITREAYQKVMGHS
ncbi:glycosyltransferase family 4 protein [Allofournierella massiliensis]|uniref:glycosyltransferase family 4 protein n=1 Tax=Allofournierella massiliensis TaxID=1650663 RepID=UPI0024B1642E|nr:glycosyltransferase family 4 protein [Fournierella massiliensis]